MLDHVTIPNQDFDLRSLLIQAIARQDIAEDEGSAINLSPPLSPVLTSDLGVEDLFSGDLSPLTDSDSEIGSPLCLSPALPPLPQVPRFDLGPSTAHYKKNLSKKELQSQPKKEKITSELKKGLSVHRRARRNAVRNALRKHKRLLILEAPDAYYEGRDNARKKHMENAEVVYCDVDAESLPVTDQAYTGLDGGSGSRRLHKLEDLIGEDAKAKFKLIKWDGSKPIAIVDKNDRVIAVLAGHPDDPNWPQVQCEAAEALESRRSQCYVPRKDRRRPHRRGPFIALRCGVSYGGGQTVPGNLLNDSRNEKVLNELNNLKAFRRISGFTSSVMATWGPKLHRHYVDIVDALHRKHPGLKRLFPGSVFCGASYNFGPRTVCFPHKDFSNLPYGWCAVTSLGNFNYVEGGHLVLWDLGLVVEFPPGCTILLPSAIVAHSNTSIGKDERRYSFAQYTAGAIFRWVDNGFQTRDAFLASLSPEEAQADAERRSGRWKTGLSLFTTLNNVADGTR